jgi:hypothetical protein
VVSFSFRGGWVFPRVVVDMEMEKNFFNPAGN